MMMAIMDWCGELRTRPNRERDTAWSAPDFTFLNSQIEARSATQA